MHTKEFMRMCSSWSAARKEVLLMLVSHLAKKGLALSSIKVYLSAVRNIIFM